MKLCGLMFVLPNVFTVFSIFCGFYAIDLCSGEASSSACQYRSQPAESLASVLDDDDEDEQEVL